MFESDRKKRGKKAAENHKDSLALLNSLLIINKVGMDSVPTIPNQVCKWYPDGSLDLWDSSGGNIYLQLPAS